MKWSKYIPEPYFSKITQGFGEYDPVNYPTSKHHLGVDHGTQGKKDVPILMPCDGRITRHIIDKTLGNCAVVLSQDEKWAFRLAHMKDVPAKIGAYKAGDKIGIVGTTGLSTSEHLHIDAWKDGAIDIGKIKDLPSIQKYCSDSHELVTKNL